MYDAILADMAKHNTRPSFTGTSASVPTYELTQSGGQWVLTLTDTNNVLSDFYVSNSGGLTTSISGNTLTIRSNTPITSAAQITLERRMPSTNFTTGFVDDVFNEILHINKNYNIRFFHFNDATFEGGGGHGKERLKELCELLISHPVKFGFRCFIRAGSFKSIEDEKYLKLLKNAGLNNIFVGIESSSDEDLLVYNKKSKAQDNEHFMTLCEKNQISPFYGFVMIHPYSTTDSVIDNYSFLIRHKSDQFSHYINCLQVYSNTPIFNRIQKDNLIYKGYDYKHHPFQYNCSQTFINDMKRFLELNFYNDMELQRLNSSYHNFIFLKNYMNAIGIIDEGVETKSRFIADIIYNKCSQYFHSLYIKMDIDSCTKNADDLINSLKSIYISVQPLKEKLLKIYLKNQMLREVKGQ